MLIDISPTCVAVVGLVCFSLIVKTILDITEENSLHKLTLVSLLNNSKIEGDSHTD